MAVSLAGPCSRARCLLSMHLRAGRRRIRRNTLRVRQCTPAAGATQPALPRSCTPADQHACRTMCPCRSNGEVLLLKRNSLHNKDKWGLPGGNIEDGDNELLATAKREATEELGSMPDFQLKGEILTK